MSSNRYVVSKPCCRMPDWEPLIGAIEADPYGEVAEKTLRLCDRPLYGAPVFRRVIAAARQAAAPQSLMRRPSGS